MTDPRARAAANNAAWCDAVCRAAGLAPEADDGLWWSSARTPPGYPDAITLRPGIDAATLLARMDGSPGASVKDSFADLDLVTHGYTVLFDATWIGHPGSTRDPVRRWEPGRLDAATGTGEDVRVLETTDGVAGRVAFNLSAAEIGVSNVAVDDGDPADLWRDLPGLAHQSFGALPLVGYEIDPTAALAAGFSPIGPLRVWLRG
ncbi:hypothetical protein [Cellulomonas rhizosphaerae]|uniref:Uncharacterized protein n=1 Tax=Cellulomonas rhizosphaerae TaxID=2293719 RepID=A0A413RIT2_9CELL|nr:hypothetical protein [Cellulomonas rhizosphaerae]RHA38213.1 hypothetical protein D1825_14955 [Cellulomonas rhizosphaerae]